MIRCRRIHLPPGPDDGTRVLVERLWPRGISKSRAALDLWLKAIAPSTGLRRWYGHDASRWQGFRQRYCDELDANPEAVAQLQAIAASGHLTLVYAARDEPGNSAQVLRDYLEGIRPR